VIPPIQSAEFVHRMEDVLDIYHLPYDPNFPVVCFDESSKQLVAEKHTSISVEPGQAERHDYEYKRNGVRNLLLFFSPLASWRHIQVAELRTHLEWAYCMRDLVDVHFPEATCVLVIQDNLNTHNPAFMYEVFEPAEAKRILDRLDFHFTPKHGSWLNMAEIEFSVLSRQCLDRRIEDEASLIQEITAWQEERNKIHATVDWQFTTDDARIKLKKLYPSINN